MLPPYRLLNIHLIEAGPRILPALSERIAGSARHELTKLGVSVKENTRISEATAAGFVTAEGVLIEANLMLWAAGVKGQMIDGLNAACVIERAARIKVNEFSQVLSHPNVYAIGDVACMTSEKNPYGHPMMAQPAIQQGKLVAKNILAKLFNKEQKAFVYDDKGSMATIGRNKAVVDLPKWKFQGVFAWFVWMFVHLFSLIGFRNKAIVFLNWVYNYIRFDRETRLIIRPYKNKNSFSFRK